MKKVVLIVLNSFVNDNRVLKEAISLAKTGFDVKVVAIHDQSLQEYEEKNGISIHRIKLKTKNWAKKKVLQILKYLEFFIKFIYNYSKADIFHCNDMDTLPIGVAIKIFFNRKARLLYDAHEYEINQIPYQSKTDRKSVV